MVTLTQRKKDQFNRNALSPTVGAPVVDPTKTRGLGEAVLYDRKDSDVTNIAGEMMKQDSHLMRLADTEGRQFANRRGLMNSTMAARASQDAALGYVTPLASQEAGQRHAENMADFAHRQRLAEARQGFGFESSLQESAFKNTMTQLAAEQGFEKAESAKDRQQAVRLLTKELRSDKSLARLDAKTRKQLVRLEAKAEKKLAEMNLSAEERKTAADMFISMQGQYQEALRTIMSNDKIGAADRNAFINSMQKMLDGQMIAIEEMTGIEIEFETGELKNPTKIFDEDDEPATVVGNPPPSGGVRGTRGGSNEDIANPYPVPKKPKKGGKKGRRNRRNRRNRRGLGRRQ